MPRIVPLFHAFWQCPFFQPAPFVPPSSGRRLRPLFLLCLGATLLTFILHAGQKPLSLDADAQSAARHMLSGLEELKSMRLEVAAATRIAQAQGTVPGDPFGDQDFAPNRASDPAGSGLIGVEYTDLTSTLGDLRAKQTSLNPQFAALMTMWLKAAGVQPGDVVAVSLTGSFPALNLAVLCACDALQLKPVIFSSVGASSYGANIPGFTWLDMETRLYQKKMITTRTRYASLGGIMDTGGGLGESGIQLGEAAIAQHGAEYIRESTPRTVVPDIERRLALYAVDGPPAAFINVGGNVTSLGWVAEAALLENGLLLPPSRDAAYQVRAARSIPTTNSPQRGILFRMFENGVPVIHLLNIERLAAAHYLPVAPHELLVDYDLRNAWINRELFLGLLFVLWLCACGVWVFWQGKHQE